MGRGSNGPHRARTGVRASCAEAGGIRPHRVPDDGLRQRGVHACRRTGPVGLWPAAAVFPGPIRSHYDRVESREASTYVINMTEQAHLEPPTLRRSGRPPVPEPALPFCPPAPRLSLAPKPANALPVLTTRLALHCLPSEKQESACDGTANAGDATRSSPTKHGNFSVTQVFG